MAVGITRTSSPWRIANIRAPGITAAYRSALSRSITVSGGLPLLAPPREKALMLSGQDIFDCPRTVGRDGYRSYHSLGFSVGFNLLGINDRDRLVHAD
ncbi:MAG TPA: hypothetical protein VMV27_15775 [Candidatus Binataceae bacterium]|nr:hypothetical protein [Candidatus Binataceae bacterium]